MYALIERLENDRREYWTGDEWVTTSVTGWRDAAQFRDHGSAAAELDQYADDPEFARATVIDVE